MQDFNVKHTSLLSLNMSIEEVTFPTQRFLKSSLESQNILRMDATQKPRKTDGKGMCF
jgi:hypothetical protein